MKRGSFYEESARGRARVLLDSGTYRELLGPFERIESPHLALQGIVPQSDDGVVVARGTIRGWEALVLSIEGSFQGGSIGEVNGTKIAAALELALRSAQQKNPVVPVIVLDTAGIRLQEANLGLLAIRDIHAAIVSLREFVPVIAVIAGRIGCFGGMGIAAALCTVLIGTEIGRLGLNGPEVIEQEAGLQEFDSRDRQLIWSTIGCRRRLEAGQIDILVEDSVAAVSAAVGDKCQQAPTSGMRLTHPFEPPSAESLDLPISPSLQDPSRPISRGLSWLRALSESTTFDQTFPSVLSCDLRWDGEMVRLIAVVPDPNGRFPRARAGQVGLEEGWGIANLVRQVIAADENGQKRAILAIVDSPGQAFGLQEELIGIHEALAAAVDAYATARKKGHPVIALLVGKAISGAFLAHGLQADAILAIDADDVEVHVMSEESVARITRRDSLELEAIAKLVPATARDIRSFASLGGVDVVIPWANSDLTNHHAVATVKARIVQAIQSARLHPPEGTDRVAAEKPQRMSSLIRLTMEKAWT
jgi:malonate decarboxylase beta subunit